MKMKNEPYIINEDSWHWRFYRWYTVMNSEHARERVLKYNIDIQTVFDYHCYKPYDFCQYWRGVLLWPLIKFLSAGVVFGLFITILIASLLQSYIVYGYITMGVIFVVTALVLVGILFHVIGELTKKTIKTSREGFIGEVYSSYKNKFCRVVEYKKGGSNE